MQLAPCQPCALVGFVQSLVPSLCTSSTQQTPGWKMAPWKPSGLHRPSIDLSVLIWGHRALGWWDLTASACQPRLRVWKPGLARGPDRVASDQCVTVSGQPQQSLESIHLWTTLLWGGETGDEASLLKKGRGSKSTNNLGSSASSSACPDSSHPSGPGFCPSASRRLSQIALAFGSLLVHLQDCSPCCLLFLLENMLATSCVVVEGGCPYGPLSQKDMARQLVFIQSGLNGFIHVNILYWVPAMCQELEKIAGNKKLSL